MRCDLQQVIMETFVVFLKISGNGLSSIDVIENLVAYSAPPYFSSWKTRGCFKA
jgi:hypothetical protein